MRILMVVCAAAVGLAVAGCTGKAELYPANDTARAVGPLKANFQRAGVGSGAIRLQLPDGEVLTGRYSVNVSGASSFGSIYATAYGTGGAASAVGSSSAFAIPNGSPGFADLYGPKGTGAQCEFFNNNLTGHGNGACRLSTGAVYRMQF
jgi:hypothetical protein